MSTKENAYTVRSPFFRSTLFQLLIVGVISLLGPGLWNANSSLGAGGALEPYLVNAGNSLVFGLMGLFCISAPVFTNWIGVKNTLILGTLGWSVYSAALYQNNRYGTEWSVLLGAAICGVSAGLYWAAEGSIVLAYPEHSKRGRYLAIWLAFKNSGQIIGGAINLGLNANRATGGKVSFVTLLIFVVLQVFAFPISFLLSSPDKVIRKDGSPVVVEERTTIKQQGKLLWKTVTSKQIGLLLPIFFASWFYWGYASTYLTLYFSVRARALASFLSGITGTLATTLLGFFLDSQRFTIRTRLRYGAVVVLTLFSSLWIWALIVQSGFQKRNPGKLDWKSAGFGRTFGLYILLNTFGNLVQNYLYFLIGTIGEGTNELSRLAGLLRGIESWGQCAAFGINSSKFSPLYTVVINTVFWFTALVPAVFSISQVQGRPAYATDVAIVRTKTGAVSVGAQGTAGDDAGSEVTTPTEKEKQLSA